MADGPTEQQTRRDPPTFGQVLDDARPGRGPKHAAADATPPEEATQPEEETESEEDLTTAQAAGFEPVEPGPGATTLTGGGGTRHLGDRIFASAAGGASGLVILIVVLVAVFLLDKALPSIADDKANFITSTQFSVAKGQLRFGVAGLLYTTVLSSVFALLLAVPLAIGIALYITQYATQRISRPVAHTIDLLAAIPSIIYGLWGIRILAPKLTPIQDALSHIGLGLFANQNVDVGTVFDAGVVLAIMILPIITAISRDVFDRTPSANKEAALALGATKWEMIRMAVLPYGRPGVISGAMLGLGRALGETIAVLLILSVVPGFSFSIFDGGATFATKITQGSGEFGKHPGPYIAAGLVLFVLTFLVNAIARTIVARRKEFV
ncbi:MAG TPA: phosphate ABC transporter permease subunit PstC [Jatrophihabitans sp.]|nr:phosphate ABC transporter permease subunit PstC [Jatrophihabitans sp.]